VFQLLNRYPKSFVHTKFSTSRCHSFYVRRYLLVGTSTRDATVSLLWLLIIWYSKFSIEMLQSGAQILRALRLEDQ
jgi:hypothetical protein